MEFLNNWIINIAVIVVLISAVELILPSNDMKKYAKFVMGLILMVAIMKPMLEILDDEFNLERYTYEVESYLESNKVEVDYDKYKEENIENTLGVFKNNLETQCEESLKAEFNDNEFSVNADITYEYEGQEFAVNKIDVEVYDKGIKRIKTIEKVSIGKESESEEAGEISELDENIKDFISDKLKISKNVINVYSNE